MLKNDLEPKVLEALEDAEVEEALSFLENGEGMRALQAWMLYGVLLGLKLGLKRVRIIRPGTVIRTGTMDMAEDPESSEKFFTREDSLHFDAADWRTRGDRNLVELSWSEKIVVEKLSIQWWSNSKPREFDVFSSPKLRRDAELVLTHRDCQGAKSNLWTHFPGWTTPTSTIQIDMRRRREDLGRIGIRNVEIIPMTPDSQTVEILPEILGHPDLVELFLTSGPPAGNKWLEALRILESIIKADAEFFLHVYRRKLAVAVALTFAHPILSFSSQGKPIDPLRRYQSFVSWEANHQLLPGHTDLSAYLLRYAVSACLEDSQLELLKNQVPKECQTPEKLCESTLAIVEYLDLMDFNITGSLSSRGFYLFCAGISNAFGVPAVVVCKWKRVEGNSLSSGDDSFSSHRYPVDYALIWLSQGKWRMSCYDLSPKVLTSVYLSARGTDFIYNHEQRFDKFLRMHAAQKNRGAYVRSQKLLWLSKFVKNRHTRDRIRVKASQECHMEEGWGFLREFHPFLRCLNPYGLWIPSS